MPDYRAVLDFDIRFANGGGLTGEGFRLDVPSADISPGELELLLVASLGLTLTGSVTITELRVVEEPHRGTRGVDAAPAAAKPGESSSSSTVLPVSWAASIASSCSRSLR